MHLKRRPDESGSMPLVILASIIVLGLVTVLFASALTSQRVTRTDRDFTRAFHGADAGLQAALAKIRVNDPTGDVSGGTTWSSPVDPVTNEGPTNGNVDYEWEATKVGREWQITASGTIDGTTRNVEATITRPSMFPGGVRQDAGRVQGRERRGLLQHHERGHRQGRGRHERGHRAERERVRRRAVPVRPHCPVRQDAVELRCHGVQDRADAGTVHPRDGVHRAGP